MNTNQFSEEMQDLFHSVMSKQHSKFATAAEDEAHQATTTEHELRLEIPREDVEYDTDIAVAMNFRKNLKKSSTNLNGMTGDTFGFREVIEATSNRLIYANSPGTTMMDYLEMSCDSTLSSSSTDDENPAKKPRTAYEIAEKLEESNDSSDEDDFTTDSELEAVTTQQDEEVETLEIKKSTEGAPANASSGEYSKSAQLRIELMRNKRNKKEQQHQCDKCTLAARVSRTNNKAYQNMMEERSFCAMFENINLKRRIACLLVYAMELMKENGDPEINLNRMWEVVLANVVNADE